ncbi:MAG: type II secretion system protein GspD [Deltaproteobacteria bacterium GWC2_55_46]|nr:MAG: type II secretion system protein GspD [Deltaproteobacteria bacterium GWA2_55_82]OGQ62996.1 MAG: type II secretion system protein GspD [Deltaproteobacteria bacterium RIFCSPLOWO2_02_FULL_55_12]OIJ72960.1 MAG: type II secretion system protein GspD [Deltaproteobacteria bacterium GWC2_55_46]
MRYMKFDKITAHLFLIILTVMLVCEPAYSQKSEGQKKGRAADITLNFVDVEISSLVKIMSEITGRNFIYDETFRGKVTIIAPGKLTSDEALNLFISALELKNFTVIPTDGYYKIIQSSAAKQSGTRVVRDPGSVRPDEYIVRLIPLNTISVQDAFSAVQPLVSKNGQISVFGTRNALLLVDTAQNIEKILAILKSIDEPSVVKAPEVIYLKYAQADAVAGILRREEQRRTGIRRGDNLESTITPDERLNAIILSDSVSDREFFRDFINLLDVPPPEASSRINVYYLENADAEDLAKVIDALIRPGAAQAAQPQPGGAPQITQEITGRISVTPSKATNSLIIMASPADYQNLVQVIEKLDRRPKQVFVEAMITEVTVDKAIELGTKFRLSAEKENAPVAIGGVGSIDASSIQTILNGLAGLTIGGLGNLLTIPVTRADGTSFNLTAPGFAVLFSLSEFKDIINVLSTPHILTSDNSEAEIMVGENVPFLASLERQAGTAGQPLLQSIERRDVGIRLKIRPKISEGDFVKLDIYQEISAVSPSRTGGAADIITTKRSAQTSVVVKNNQTVVIGGLIQNRNTSNTTKVPLLGDIPLFGWLFKSTTDQRQKTNLLVFITPYIIEDFKGLEDLRDRKQREFDKNGALKGRLDKNGSIEQEETVNVDG